MSRAIKVRHIPCGQRIQEACRPPDGAASVVGCVRKSVSDECVSPESSVSSRMELMPRIGRAPLWSARRRMRETHQARAVWHRSCTQSAPRVVCNPHAAASVYGGSSAWRAAAGSAGRAAIGPRGRACGRGGEREKESGGGLAAAGQSCRSRKKLSSTGLCFRISSRVSPFISWGKTSQSSVART